MSDESGLGAKADSQMLDEQPVKWVILQTWEVLKANFWTLLGLYFLPALIFFGFAVGAFMVAADTNTSGELVFSDDSSAIAILVSALVLIFLAYIYVYLRIMGGLITKIVGYLKDKARFGLGEVWNAGSGQAWPVMKTIFFITWPIFAIYLIAVAASINIIFSIEPNDSLEELAPLLFIGFMTFVAVLLAGYYIFMRWAVAVQAVVIEKLDVVSGKRRSEELMNESKMAMRSVFWAIVGISFIGSLLGNIPIIGLLISVLMTLAWMAAPAVIYTLTIKRAPKLSTAKKSEIGLDTKV